MTQCPKCGNNLAENAIVCPRCGYLPPGPDDFQLAPVTGIRPTARPLLDELAGEDATEQAAEADVHQPTRERAAYDFESERKFLDFGLPALVLVPALMLYIALSLRIFGARGGAGIVAQDLALLLLVELPLTVGLLTVLGILCGISLGWLSSGILKLATLGIANRAVSALVIVLLLAGMHWQASLAGLLGVGFLLWFIKTVFDLTVYEMILLWVGSWLSAALLYGAFRFLFQLPGLF